MDEGSRLMNILKRQVYFDSIEMIFETTPHY